MHCKMHLKFWGPSNTLRSLQLGFTVSEQSKADLQGLNLRLVCQRDSVSMSLAIQAVHRIETLCGPSYSYSAKSSFPA